MMDDKSPSSQEEDVREYFERVARRFDSYYREEADTGGLIGKIAHLVFRKPAMACRFAETFNFLGDLKDKTVLDAGCGSGIYSIEIAKRGGRALGVDVSQVMIDLARENARREGVEERCVFAVDDLMSLVRELIDREIDELHAEGVQVRFVGRIDRLASLRRSTTGRRRFGRRRGPRG